MEGFQRTPLVCQDNLQVRLDGQVANSRAWVQKCSYDMRWSVILLEVDWRAVLLGTFEPNVLSLKLCPGVESMMQLVWDPFRKKGKEEK